jgi:hypothetical protein
MRQVIMVLGFSLIILILITGCISAQNRTSIGSDNPSPVLKDTPDKNTSLLSQASPAECNLSSTDPIVFQKFLPNVPGYERAFGQNISEGNNYRNGSPGLINGIEDHYKIPGEFTENTMSVSIYDLGPCVTELTGVNASLNNYQFGKYRDTTESKTNFHGYPAIHVIRTIFASEYLGSDSYRIGINNRIYVVISRYDPSEKGFLLSEAEADIEKFANAIDFNGLASAV